MQKSILLSLIGIIITFSLSAQSEARLLRFPTVSKQSVVFTYAGDLYAVPKTGGLARKLTSDSGNEVFARFSPDGATLAFTGQYDGNTEVYTMPANGGIPKRMTYTATLGRDDLSDRMGPNNIVMTWTPDNTGIVYRSRRISFNDFKGQLFVAPMAGGMSRELPMSVGGFCSYAPDGKRMALNQVFREFRTWKYYRGGMADDVWIYDTATGSMENITNHVAQDIFPMWHGNQIFFASDRDRTMNLFVYDLTTKETKKITQFTEYDVKFPSLGAGTISYENGGYIYLYDIATGTNTKLTIQIADDAVTGRDEWVDASQYIANGDYDLGMDGNRLVVAARGDIWTLPAKEGITRNLTKTSGVHERSVAWSPDGMHVAYISDASGEDEIYVQKQDGSEPAKKLTSGADTYKFSLIWSPDSKKIAWTDKKMRLQVVDVSNSNITLVDQSKSWEHGNVTWSSDSKWIAFDRSDDDGRGKVYLYDVAGKKSHLISDNWYESYGATFSPDGKYIYFVSNRDFSPRYSATEWNHSYSDMSKVYLVTLAKSTPSPFAPKNDEVQVKQDTTSAKTDTADSKSSKSKDKKADAAPAAKSNTPDIKVDIDGIQQRIAALPVSAGNYYGLYATDDGVYYITNSSSAPKTTMKYFQLKDKKETEIGEYGSYVVSADRKKMALYKDRAFAVIDMPKDKASMDKKVDLTGMRIMIDRKKEWAQIFEESWRQMRDFFYDPGMHGVNWPAIRTKYQPLVPHVNHRHDLSYIIGEMIGELNVGHAYVGGGDAPKSERIQLGLLGARISRDASGYFKIDEILPGENWSSSTRSPLTEIGVNVKQGDLILAINGVSTNTVKDYSELLIGTAGKTVELTVNDKPDMKGSRKSLVTPTSDEADLYYLRWVRRNVEYVNQKTNGQVGYIHVPDMSSAGLNEFVKYFYPQLDKKAWIIDDRGNGGGNVSPQIIERLLRTPVFFDLPRNATIPRPDPELAFGPKVMLVDQYSASDGDIFPYRFRANKLGKIIGRRTWGGVVGIRGSLPFVDGGFLNRPEFAGYDVAGKTWPLEGHGIDPDIVIYNNPADEYKGKDDQLDKAIEVILEELKTAPGIPAPPPYIRNN